MISFVINKGKKLMLYIKNDFYSAIKDKRVKISN